MFENVDKIICDKLLKKGELKQKELFDYQEIISPSKNNKNSLYFETLTDNEFFDLSGAKKEFVDFYNKIIKSRVGTIIFGGVYLGLDNRRVNNIARISIDETIMGKYQEIVKNAHTANCKVFLKIKSAYGRYNELGNTTNTSKIASNFGLDPNNKQKILIRASDAKCNEIVADFAQTVMLANIAGFDGIVIDASFCNLIGELSNPLYNKRIFGYFSDTTDLLTNMLKAVQADNNTIILKFSLNILFCNNIKNAKQLKNLRNFTSNLADLLNFYVKLGVDGFEFIFGEKETEFLLNFNTFEEECLFEEFVTEVREYFVQNNVKNKFGEDVILFYHDNFKNISKLNKLVKNQIINYVDVTKNIYSDVNFISKLLKKKSCLNCIKCSYCDQKSQFNFKNECLINPFFHYPQPLIKNGNNRIVAVIGSGISGLICSLTLAERGFIVHLFEQKSKLNHIGKLTSVFGFDDLLLDYYNYIEDKVNNYVLNKKIVLFQNQKFATTSQDLGSFSAIIVATGFNKKFLSISGAVQSHVHNIYDALENESLFKKKNIVIYAKSMLSLKLALFLSKSNKNITIIIKNTDWLIKNKNANLFYFFWNLYKNNANIYFLSRIIKINEDNLDLLFNKNFNCKSIDTFLKIISNDKLKMEQRQINLDCDLLIYEPDITPNNKLYADIVQSNYKGEVYLVGSALENSNLADIIKSGYFVGKNL